MFTARQRLINQELMAIRSKKRRKLQEIGVPDIATALYFVKSGKHK